MRGRRADRQRARVATRDDKPHPRHARPGHEPRHHASRTARRTRSSSSRDSTPARRSPAPSVVDHQARTARRSGPARPSADGVAIAPQTPLRDAATTGAKFAFIVTAEKDGDVAYVGSDWNEGILPWDFGIDFNLDEAEPLLRGTVFTDRGVYKLGEEVHVQGDPAPATRPHGIRLLPAGTPVSSSRPRQPATSVVDERTVTVNAWSSAEWTLTLPAEGTLGNYSRARHARERPAEAAKPEDRAPSDEPVRRPTTRAVHEGRCTGRSSSPRTAGRTSASTSTLTGDAPIAGDAAEGRRHGALPVRRADGRAAGDAGRSRASPGYRRPPAIARDVPRRTAGCSSASSRSTRAPERETVSRRSDDARRGRDSSRCRSTTDARRRRAVRLHARRATSRTCRASTSPTAPASPSIRRRGTSASAAAATSSSRTTGSTTEIVAVGLDGQAVAGVPVDVTLTQVQWNSVRRAEGNGFYTWDTERKEVPGRARGR